MNSWPHRKEDVVNLIAFHEPDFLGTQEGMAHQLKFMDNKLEKMEWIGLSRENSREKGEFSALFYNSRKFELVTGSDSTAWLSPTPSEVSTGWDADLPRIVTWGKFRERSTGRAIYVFNTHFDHIGDTARAKSADLIRRTIEDMVGGEPFILTGDFNATPDSRPYAILTKGSLMRDAYEVPLLPHVGPSFTFEGFSVQGGEPPRRIDYIFVGGDVKVRNHAIISSFSNGYYPSDHLPVVADLVYR